MTPVAWQIAANRDAHVLAIGEPSGPAAIARFSVELGRAWGKTYEMIRGLPDDGNAIVLVQERDHWTGWMRQRVLCQRPGYPVDRLKIMSRGELHRQGSPLFDFDPLTNKLPVFVDNAVTDALTVEFVERLQPRRVP